MTNLAGVKVVKDALMDDEVLGGVSPTLQCKMREALRLVATAANQYTTCEKEQEGALVTVRTLKAAASDPDEAEVAAALKERTQMWERARAQRRKYVALQSLKAPTKSKIDALTSKMPGSKLGVSNHLFVWCADLTVESNLKPWCVDSPAKSRDRDVVLQWMSATTGSGDFCMSFDGRKRKERAYIEEKMGGGGKSPEEVIVFYASDSDVCEGSLVHQACVSHSENEREDRGHSVPRNSGCVPDLEDICRCANGRE